MSTESIASTTPPVGAPETCRGCGVPLAEDQRYCLECGERRVQASSVLLGGVPAPADAASSAPPSAPPLPAAARGGGERSNAVTVIAGVGVLLLAMGIGVLIGRSGASKSSGPVAPQVITVAPAASGSTGSAGASTTEASTFSDDWPAGKTGYTVQLQTLVQASTTTSQVQAAKSAASAKGAKGVGALKSEDFSSLTAGSYVIYAGEYGKQAEARKALTGLKKSFPGASVVKVSNGGASSPSTGSSPSAGASHSSSGAGSSESHPAPPKVLEEEHKSKGKSFEEKSKNLPDVVGT
ncbi:MAG TPA: hypothetical protein VN804_06205 [Solirubrobacteraceae bacterium]|nr:hypothetical protein [Solirubrobacteraceae bacterium]